MTEEIPQINYSPRMLVSILMQEFRIATRMITTIRKNLNEQDNILLMLYAQVDIEVLIQSKEFLGQLIQSVTNHRLPEYMGKGYLKLHIFKIKEYYDLL